MDNLEKIKDEEKLIAIILRSNHHSDKIEFFSPPDFSQQLGYLPHKKGNIIPAHFHKEVHRKVTVTQEVLFIRKGRVLVNFYSTDQKFIASRELGPGDVLFLCSGGHGFKILEDTEMIEVKQGPYSGKDSDKVLFEGVEK
uniref:Cupin domain-containing protein n=1 Tax=candidate division CPR3 bacterium TaxID=2268181 RepID=A0A7V3N548_UNCC3